MEGIVNGMDVTDWSPDVDKYLDVTYDKDTVEEGKAVAKETLQAELGLDVRSRHSCILPCFSRREAAPSWPSCRTLSCSA